MEEWRRIPEFPEYEISNYGQIRRIGKTKILKTFKDKRGYLRISLRVGGIKYHRYIHSIVMEAYEGPQPLGYDVHHKDENKTNNYRGNLQYLISCKHREPTLIKNQKGEDNNNAILTTELILKIRSEYKYNTRGYGCTSLSKKYNLTEKHIFDIIKRRIWNHV